MASTIKADTLQSTTSNVFVLNSSGTEYARFDSSGNIGIGTTSPSAKLDVNGNIALPNATALQFKDSGGTRKDTLQLNSSSNIVLQSPSASIFQINGSTEAMRIDSAGRVTMPYQPSFSTQRSTGLAAPNIIIFDTVLTNIGSNYSNSTGRFTAPVAGVYFFYMTFTCDRTTTTGDYYVDIRKNASIFLRVYTQGDSDASAHPSQSGQIILTMAVGDYVDCNFGSGATGIHANSIHNVFGGHLIG